MMLSLLIIVLVSLGLLGIAAAALWGILAILGEPAVSEDSFRRVINLLFEDAAQEEAPHG